MTEFAEYELLYDRSEQQSPEYRDPVVLFERPMLTLEVDVPATMIEIPMDEPSFGLIEREHGLIDLSPFGVVGEHVNWSTHDCGASCYADAN